MKVRFAVTAAAMLAVAACSTEATPAGDESVAPVSPVASSDAPPTSADAPAKGNEPTKEFLIGKWGTDGDCELAVDLRADGTSDGPFGNWSYSDGSITFAEAPELKIHVTVIDDNTMESDNGMGKTSTMTRCP